ncbi:MAG: hypothetical protein K0R25_797 [Rickettsiaceae bacterium]|jgi:hypothetical protein|nr:hypothetical protein [Rickettsiaceae bacterium]
MKRLALLLSLTIASCSTFEKKEEPMFNTEIFCPQSSYRFLILKSTRQEVEQSIVKAIEQQEKGNKKNRYTVLQFPNQSSTSIYNVSPQELSRCELIERSRNVMGRPDL